MYRENANKPAAGIEKRERDAERNERSEKQKGKVKDVRKTEKKREK